MPAIHLGTQSWSYRAWVGPFYPPETARGDMLRWYGRMFSTLEVAATFHATPAEPILRAWGEMVPDDFVFSLKVPQEITHARRLVGSEGALTKFVDRVAQLGNSLGPLLVQLPPDFMPSRETRAVLQHFIAKLPRHNRWAIEFRHPAWLDAETMKTLRDHNIALTLVDGRWVSRPKMLEVAAAPTANFTYVRWMGLDGQITDHSRPQLDRETELAAWAEALKALDGSVGTVFGYFNNQFQGHGPHSVRAMQRLLGEAPVEPAVLHASQEFL